MLRSLFQGVLAALVASASLGGPVAFAQTAPGAPAKDPRLDTKVSLTVSNAKLTDVAAKLSAQTGVVIRAGGSNREWRVREQRVTVTAKGVPLETLMDGVAGMLGFRVGRVPSGGKTAYFIWQDKNSLELQAELAVSQSREAAQRTAEARQSALDTLARSLTIPAAQAQADKEKDPWMAYLVGTKAGRGYAKLMTAVCATNPEARDLVLHGRRAVIPLGDLSPEVRQAAMETAYGGFLRGSKCAFLPPASAVRPYQLVVMPIGVPGDSGTASIGFGGLVIVTGIRADNEGLAERMPYGGAGPLSLFPLTTAGTPLGGVYGRQLTALEAGADRMQAAKKAIAEMRSPNVAEDLMGRRPKTEQKPAADPELDREVELGKLPIAFDTSWALGGERKSDGETVLALSEALGRPVLLESYPDGTPLALLLRSGRQPVRSIVIALEKTGYTWQFGQGMLLIRPDDWAIRRTWMVSESFLARFRNLMRKNGALSLDNLGELAAALSDEQLQSAVMTDSCLMPAVIGNIGNSLDVSYDVVRLYGSLSSSQKAALKSATGLDFAQLSTAQWNRLNDAVQENLGPMQMVGGHIKLRSKPVWFWDMTVCSFRVAVQASGASSARTFTLSTPVYGKNLIAFTRRMTVETVSKAFEGQKKKPIKPQKPRKLKDAPAKAK